MIALAIREQQALRVVVRTEEHLQVKLLLSCGCLAVVNVWDLAARRLDVDQAVAVLLSEHACARTTWSTKKPAQILRELHDLGMETFDLKTQKSPTPPKRSRAAESGPTPLAERIYTTTTRRALP